MLRNALYRLFTMLQKRNRKGQKYFRYVGFLFLCLGIALILTCSYILFSPYIFGNPFISPLAKNFKTQNSDIKSLFVKEKINISSFSVATDSSYMVELASGGTVILASDKDLYWQVRSLQIILSRLTIEGKRFKTLDFRFDKPVVSF